MHGDPVRPCCRTACRARRPAWSSRGICGARAAGLAVSRGTEVWTARWVGVYGPKRGRRLCAAAPSAGGAGGAGGMPAGSAPPVRALQPTATARGHSRRPSNWVPWTGCAHLSEHVSRQPRACHGPQESRFMPCARSDMDRWKFSNKLAYRQHAAANLQKVACTCDTAHRHVMSINRNSPPEHIAQR